MLAIGKTLVSEDLLERRFVCDLASCKGACCVQGDSGAPLEEHEIGILEESFPYVKPYMTMEGIERIEREGVCEIDADGDAVIPTVQGERCSFVFFDNGIARCAIERAFEEGKTGFRKPVSCHLFPVRVKKFPEYEAVNYEERAICAPACACGKKLDVAVYRFLKEPLVRKFGKDWYDQLEAAASRLST